MSNPKKTKKRRQGRHDPSSSTAATPPEETNRNTGLLGSFRTGMQNAASGESKWLNIALWVIAGVVLIGFLLRMR